MRTLIDIILGVLMTLGGGCVAVLLLIFFVLLCGVLKDEWRKLVDK